MARDVTDEPLPSSFGANRYTVDSVLGEGGQATSFLALDTRGGKRVVVKRFRVRGAKSWKEVDLAEREASVMAALHHAALPRYVDHFEEDGSLFLVTEYIEGESLAARLKRGERLSEQEVIAFLGTAANALEYLHGRAPPLIHRDIKPSNVLRRPDGTMAIIDFGAVRDRLKPEGGSTVVGTFGYMAPEQFQGRALPASDVYAVGATALVLLTGSEPENLPHRGLAIDVHAALRGLNVSPRLVGVLSTMLEPDPDKRASSIAPLLTDPPQARRRDDLMSEVVASVSNAHERHLNRFARRQARKQAARERRAARRPHWVQGYGEPLELGGPVRWIVALALRIASLATRVALLLVVAPLLTVFAKMFGRVMREAADDVRLAERTAQDEIQRARAFTIERPAAAAVQGSSGQVRVSVEPRAAADADPHDVEVEQEQSAHERRRDRELP